MNDGVLRKTSIISPDDRLRIDALALLVKQHEKYASDMGNCCWVALVVAVLPKPWVFFAWVLLFIPWVVVSFKAGSYSRQIRRTMDEAERKYRERLSQENETAL